MYDSRADAKNVVSVKSAGLRVARNKVKYNTDQGIVSSHSDCAMASSEEQAVAGNA